MTSFNDGKGNIKRSLNKVSSKKTELLYEFSGRHQLHVLTHRLVYGEYTH